MEFLFEAILYPIHTCKIFTVGFYVPCAIPVELDLVLFFFILSCVSFKMTNYVNSTHSVSPLAKVTVSNQSISIGDHTSYSISQICCRRQKIIKRTIELWGNLSAKQQVTKTNVQIKPNTQTETLYNTQQRYE